MAKDPGHHLWCDRCGSKEFNMVFKLKVMQSQGTAREPGGYTCVGCGKEADTGAMQKQYQLAHREWEIAQMRGEPLDTSSTSSSELPSTLTKDRSVSKSTKSS